MVTKLNITISTSLCRCGQNQYIKDETNFECPAYRTWKVLSFLLRLLLVLSKKGKAPLRHFKLGAQNWCSNNPQLLSQVLSTFYFSDTTVCRKGRWKEPLKSQPPHSTVECRSFSLFLLLLFAHYTAVMAVTQRKVHKRPILWHLRLNFYSV